MSLAIHPDWIRPDWEAPQVRAFMSTRAGGVSTGPYASLNVGSAVQDEPAAVEENRRRVAEALGAQLVFLPQVHGSKVLTLKPEWARPEARVPKADACISTIPGLGCAIQVADCLPVLFAAPKAVGGAHAGWRGLAGGVLENTVQALCEASGCEPGEIQAWLGACIGPEAFEVGADVLEAFGVEPSADLGAAQGQLFRYQPNAAGEPRWRANLAALAALRLRAAGVTRQGGGRWCTFSDPSRFFSYRRERLSGRMVAAITLA
ncbi:peptidoglycan editing factor PgeF [Pelomonas sp. BJYL3]|uniref:peptidoglycan editing factor PgeF n=1 Tax=Pelomonas sp. BJYL3 TaxID=2976697 RepID=UPI0022B45A07|nr:peptidoglycan editing factor PgeF [Pelomonas sp. BJYL3]